MFKRIPIKKFRDIHPSAAVLGGDVLGAIRFYGKKRGKLRKFDKYRLKVLSSLCKGLFCGLITDLEYGRARNIVGEKEFYELVNSKVSYNRKVKCFEIQVAPYLSEYKELSAYTRLFKLVEDKNMHTPNLTSIIAAIDLRKPIVSYDPHFYWQRKSIHEAFKERHVEEKADIEIYTPQDFCKLVLRV